MISHLGQDLVKGEWKCSSSSAFHLSIDFLE
jgi:hypothetical protein